MLPGPRGLEEYTKWVAEIAATWKNHSIDQDDTQQVDLEPGLDLYKPSREELIPVKSHKPSIAQAFNFPT